MPETALHKAARDGSMDEVQDLIASGALDINEKGAQGEFELDLFISLTHLLLWALERSARRASDACLYAGLPPCHRRPNGSTSLPRWWVR